MAAAKAAESGSNGLLGHWGEQKRWRRLGPKKQRKLKYGEGGREKVTGEGETQNLFNESSVNHELLMRKMMCGVFLCSPCT